MSPRYQGNYVRAPGFAELEKETTERAALAMGLQLSDAIWVTNPFCLPSVRSPYSACCYKNVFIQQKIPALLIKSYQDTPSHCSHRTVRCVLLRGKFTVSQLKP
uniref:Uncharacterized protein n=1 Tax=Melopsittacus undulatus TaxID=13146 RepID=A0A8V5G1A4_MELUD